MQTLASGEAFVLGDRVKAADGTTSNRCTVATSSPATYVPPTPEPYTPFPTARVRPTAVASKAVPVLVGSVLFALDASVLV